MYRSCGWRSTSLLLVLVGVVPLADAAQVSINGRLTSFQSALAPVSPFTPDGNGTLDGSPLVIDASLPAVQYVGGDPAFYPQSQVVTLGAGTTSVQFEYTNLIGDPASNPNIISFVPAGPSDVTVGDVFKVGTISYTNGFWFPYARIGLSISTVSTDAALAGHDFSGDIIVAVSSPDPFDPTDFVANADYFFLQDASGPLSPLGSVRVYERAFQPRGNPGNAGSADLYARIGSLIPTRFDHPQGGAFLAASLDPITDSNPVSEPTTLMLLAGSLALFAARAGMLRRGPGKRWQSQRSRRRRA